jgi:hypothetical protein
MLSIIVETGAAICTAVIVAQCNFTSISWDLSIQNLLRLGGHVDFCPYFESCIWPDNDFAKEQLVYIKFHTNLGNVQWRPCQC